MINMYQVYLTYDILLFINHTNLIQFIFLSQLTNQQNLPQTKKIEMLFSQSLMKQITLQSKFIIYHKKLKSIKKKIQQQLRNQLDNKIKVDNKSQIIEFILLQNNIKMELKTIRVQIIKEDEEPEFNVDDFEVEEHRLKDQQEIQQTPIKQRQLSKLSQASNTSHVSSILSSPSKLPYNKSRQLDYISLSPDKSPAKSKFNIRRPVFSAHKNKSVISRGEIHFQRTSYSPTISPQRKSVYWQSWLLPMNSTMRETVKEELPKITAQGYCVMMADTGEVLTAHDEKIQRQIASLTKLMTAYTALSICSTFGIKIRQHYVTISRQAAYMNGTSAGLKLDEDILIIDLLYALLLPSGNDAGIAIAQYFGKFLSYKFAQDMNSNQKQKTSMQKFRQFKEFYDQEYDKESLRLFIFQMNKNCHKIGLKSTHFNNPTGLSDKSNYSTAKDMALFTGHCLKNHTLRLIFKKKFHICEVRNSRMCTVRQFFILCQRQVEWKNTNRHLFQFRECIGVKTGITPNAGPCLSSAYKVMGREMVVIVLQCQSVEARYKDAEALFKWARKKVRAF